MNKGLYIKLVLSLLGLFMAPMLVFAVEPCFDETAEYESRFNDCEIKAKQGDSKAQYILSKIFRNSPLSKGTDHQAFIWTKKLADLGVIPAQIKLAEMYHFGQGAEQNDMNAYTYAYIVSANQHYHEDDIRKFKGELAEKLTTPQVKKAKISAVEWLVDTRQYSLGHDGFVYWVLAEIFRGRSEKWYAFEASLTAAALDNKDAQRLIVNMFQYDKELLGVISDKALDSIQKTAKEESRQQLVLGYMYFYGNTVPQSYTEALKWYIAAAQVSVHDAAEQTFTDYDHAINLVASHLLAWMYDTGQGIEQDYKQAFEWYKKAADAGYGDAQLRLAEMYQLGLGIEQNNQLAIEWYQTAAEQDYHKAQRVLADLYRTGTLLKQDSKLAFKWYKKAAVLEDLPAQYALAEMYYQGEGTAKDDSKA